MSKPDFTLLIKSLAIPAKRRKAVTEIHEHVCKANNENSKENSLALLQQGALLPLLLLIKATTQTTQNQVLKILFCFTADALEQCREMATQGIISALTHKLSMSLPDQQADILAIMTNLTDHFEDARTIAVEHGLIEKSIALLNSESPQVKAFAAALLFNISKHDTNLHPSIVTAIPKLVALLTETNLPAAKLDALSILADLGTDNKENCQAIRKAGGYSIAEALQNDADPGIAAEAKFLVETLGCLDPVNRKVAEKTSLARLQVPAATNYEGHGDNNATSIENAMRVTGAGLTQSRRAQHGIGGKFNKERSRSVVAHPTFTSSSITASRRTSLAVTRK